jgi:hypothetical protein
MQASDQLHAPAVLHMGKEPPVISLNRRLDGPKTSVVAMQKTANRTYSTHDQLMLYSVNFTHLYPRLTQY